MKLILGALALTLVVSWAYGKSETLKGAEQDLKAFKKEMSVKLDDVEKQLGELRAKAKSKGGELQTKTIAELEATRDKLKVEIDSINEDAKSSWKKLKMKISASVDSLHKSAKKALRD